MKNQIYVLLASILCMACCKDKPETINKAPGVPLMMAPENAELCLESAVVFEWNPAVDPDGDVITYEIQVALDQQFSNIVFTSKTAAVDQLIALEKNSLYYWRIKAVDSKGLSGNYSAIRTFYTAGDAKVNHLPFAPELLRPAMDSLHAVGAVTLEWNALDADSEDILVYDVYCEAANPPIVKIAENTAVKTLEITAEAGKEYFWRVVVKDNHGAETTGQIWKFKTN